MYSMDLSGPPHYEVWAGRPSSWMMQAFLHSPTGTSDTLTPADPTSRLCDHYISQRLPRGMKRSREHPQVNANAIDLSSLGTGGGQDGENNESVRTAVVFELPPFCSILLSLMYCWSYCILNTISKYPILDRRVLTCLSRIRAQRTVKVTHDALLAGDLAHF